MQFFLLLQKLIDVKWLDINKGRQIRKILDQSYYVYRFSGGHQPSAFYCNISNANTNYSQIHLKPKFL